MGEGGVGGGSNGEEGAEGVCEALWGLGLPRAGRGLGRQRPRAEASQPQGGGHPRSVCPRLVDSPEEGAACREAQPCSRQPIKLSRREGGKGAWREGRPSLTADPQVTAPGSSTVCRSTWDARIQESRSWGPARAHSNTAASTRVQTSRDENTWCW